MAQAVRTKKNQQVQQRRQQQEISNDEEWLEEPVSMPYRRAYEMAEKFATTRIGQFVMTRGDRMLQTIEATAKWALPSAQMEDKLQRPLPWLPFLTMIIALRLACIGVSVAALCIGNRPVRPQDVVYFIQTRRRKLRAMRLRGLQEINRREAEALARQSSNRQHTVIAQLKILFASAICRPGQHREPERRIVIHHTREGLRVENIENDPSDEQVAKRPRSDTCDDNLTPNEMLEKYAQENSDDDSDFIPDPADETNDELDTSTTSTENESENKAVTESETQNQESATSSETTTEQQQTEKRKQLSSPELDTTLEQSVELKENGGDDTLTMPTPLAEMKMEIVSENETNNQAMTTQANGPSNGAENRETDVAFQFVLTPPTAKNNEKTQLNTTETVTSDKERGATGHENAKETRFNIGAAAKAGSPPDFNAYHQRQVSFQFNDKPQPNDQSHSLKKTSSEPGLCDTATTNRYYRSAPFHARRSNASHDQQSVGQQQHQQGYGHHQQGYGQYQQGHGQNQQGYGQHQQGHGQNQQGYGQPQQNRYRGRNRR